METNQVSNQVSTEQVDHNYVALCRQGKTHEVIESLYSNNIVSKEMPNWPGQVVIEGIEGVRKKNEDWYANVEEFHSGEVSDPLVAGKHFSVTMNFDVTFKDSGRQQMEEVCVFEVNDGKIVSEQFFYSM